MVEGSHLLRWLHLENLRGDFMQDARNPERPSFTNTQAGELASSLFNLLGDLKEIKELPSERYLNFHFILDSGQEYVLKISANSEYITTLDMQNSAMHHLADNIEGQSSPLVYKSRNDIEIEQVKDDEGNSHYVRLLSFIPGKLLSQVNPQFSDLQENYGRFIGLISKALSDFDHSAAHRQFYWDLKRASTVIGTYAKHILNPEKQELVGYFLELFDTTVLPIIDTLRTSVIHNDANDNNIVVLHPYDRNQRMFSVLDLVT